MGQYVHYTAEEKRQANLVNLEQLLQAHGERLIPAGREKRLECNHSITIRGNCWYDHATEKGGLAIDFVKMYYGKTFSEAMAFLLSETGTIPLVRTTENNEKEKITLIVPEKHTTMRRLYAYLIKERNIDESIVSAFVREGLLYESWEYNKKTEKAYHNAIFVGRDPSGEIQHIHKKGLRSGAQNYKGNQAGSNPDYSFQYRGISDCVYLFEAPVDLLSYVSLHQEEWQQHSYIALMGVSGKALQQYLKDRPDTKTVILCLDNDKAGNQAIERLRQQIKMDWPEVTIRIEQSILKDWNEDLKAIRAEHTVENNMQMALG